MICACCYNIEKVYIMFIIDIWRMVHMELYGEF